MVASEWTVIQADHGSRVWHPALHSECTRLPRSISAVCMAEEGAVSAWCVSPWDTTAPRLREGGSDGAQPARMAVDREHGLVQPEGVSLSVVGACAGARRADRRRHSDRLLHCRAARD